jgi:hypothetical protein
MPEARIPHFRFDRAFGGMVARIDELGGLWRPLSRLLAPLAGFVQGSGVRSSIVTPSAQAHLDCASSIGYSD